MTSKQQVEQEEEEEKNDEKKKKKPHGKDIVSIPEALEVVRPNTDMSSDISSEARELMFSFVNNFVEELVMEASPTALPTPQETAELAEEAAGLTKSNKRAKISTRDIGVTNPWILPSRLAKHAVSDGTKTVPNDAEAAPTDIPRDETTVLDLPSTARPVSNIPLPRMTVTINIPPPGVRVAYPISSEGSNSDPRRPPRPRVPDLNRSPPVSISDSSSDEVTASDSAAS